MFDVLAFAVACAAVFVAALVLLGLTFSLARGFDYGLRFVWDNYWGAFGTVFGSLFLLGCATVGSMVLVLALF